MIMSHASQKRLAEMIRVDHAGEHGAVRIYDGQLAIFGKVKGMEKTADLIRHMAEQEQEHLNHFDKLIVERQVRPTALGAFWDIAGFTLGAATALMGEKAAMACTAAVETEIDAHYAAQLEELAASGADDDLQKTIEKFRADEAEHKQTALDEGASEAPGYELMTKIIRFGCRTAISVSEKI
jgi:ubiquinone biosynthesis monooxygenase Coq7